MSKPDLDRIDRKILHELMRDAEAVHAVVEAQAQDGKASHIWFGRSASKSRSRVVSATTDRLPSSFRVVMSALRFHGHDPVLAIKKPAAAHSPSDSGHGPGRPGARIRDGTAICRTWTCAEAEVALDFLSIPGKPVATSRRSLWSRTGPREDPRRLPGRTRASAGNQIRTSNPVESTCGTDQHLPKQNPPKRKVASAAGMRWRWRSS